MKAVGQVSVYFKYFGLAASNANPHNLWLTGRYVEADHPNRNAARQP